MFGQAAMPFVNPNRDHRSKQAVQWMDACNLVFIAAAAEYSAAKIKIGAKCGLGSSGGRCARRGCGHDGKPRQVGNSEKQLGGRLRLNSWSLRFQQVIHWSLAHRWVV
jgi:hypothetical protein